MQELTAYIPMDRRQAIARGETLPDRCAGAALFADISGFTPLARILVHELGRKVGAEELVGYINAVYKALIVEVHRYKGSVVSFAGDAITCWFEELPAERFRLSATQPTACARAVACGLAMQAAMEPFAALRIAGGAATPLRIKVGIAAGPARRFLVGDPAIRIIDALTGATMQRMAAAEQAARAGEVAVSGEIVEQLGRGLVVGEWRAGEKDDKEGKEQIAIVSGMAMAVDPTPWPPLPAGGVPEAEVRPWLLPEVYERLQTGASFLGDLRPVTPLMLRFGGLDFDGDEQAGQKLDAYVRRVQAVIHRYGGSLIQLIIGDKGAFLYAPFGAPLAHEDDVQRASLAALELQTLPSPGMDPVQIGLSRGKVWTGECGAPGRRTYGVMGSDVNLAARLMVRAGPGQILVSQRMHRPAQFHYHPAGAVTYKGFAQPIPTYRLLATGATSGREFPETMVGRQAELEQLLDLAAPLFVAAPIGAFQAGAVLIYGEAGIGKSRLAYALREALGERVTWLTAHTDPILRQAFNSFVYLLRRYFDQSPTAPAAENKARFEQRLAELELVLDSLPASIPRGASPQGDNIQYLLSELQRTQSFLGALLGLHWPGSLHAQLEDPQLRYQNTLIAIRCLLLAESCRRPLVVELEDGHWLDEASQEMLADISRNVVGYPLLLLINSRYADDGSRPGFPLWPDLPATSLDLEALPPASLARQAEEILGGSAGEELLALLQARTGGNPFFAQQVLVYLQEQSLLALGPDGTWQTAGDAAALALPDSINTILVARIDRLAGRVKDVVQTAAILGHEFEVQVLARMLRADVLPQVQIAERQQVWSVLRELRYLFKHALLRDAAYEMLLRARRRELHQLAAEALERLYADALAIHYGDIAYHYEAAYRQGLAGVRGQAAAYLRRAGERAAAQFANDEAVRLLSRALELTPETEPAERYKLLLAREKVYDLLGNRPAQEVDLETLDGIAITLGAEQQSRIAARQANYFHQISQYAASATAARQSIAHARQTGEQTLMARGEMAWGTALLRQGDYQAAHHHLETAVSILDRIEQYGVKATALRLLGVIFYYQGDYEAAQKAYQQSLELAQQLGDRQQESLTLNNLGLVWYDMGDLSRAQEAFAQTLVVDREHGDRFGIAGTLNNVGIAAYACGQYESARQALEQSQAIAREIGNRQGEGNSLYNLGRVYHELGDLIQAVECYRQALDIKCETGDPWGEARTLYSLGKVSLDGGDLDGARRYLHKALTLEQQAGLLHFVAEDWAALARLALAEGDLARAQARVNEILHYREDNPTFDGAFSAFDIFLSCYQVLAASQDPRAVRLLADAYALLLERASRISDEQQRGSFLEQVPGHRAIVVAWEGVQL